MDLLFKKLAAGETPETSASPLPQVEVIPKTAPGQQGPRGLSPRSNYSRVNSGTIPSPDVGASSQKAMPPMLPKVASEESMGSMSTTPTLQQMVKAAMAGAQSRAGIAAEATRQMQNLGEKTAEENSTTEEKMASVSSDYAEKYAAALEYALPFLKVSNEVGSGPNALHVTQAQASTPMKEDTGQAHHQPPLHPGTQKTNLHGPATQADNDYARAPGGNSVMVQKNAAALLDVLKKTAEEDKSLEKKETEGMSEAKKGLDKAESAHEKEQKKESSSLVDILLEKTKQAEDAINPAKISAGPAVPPNTSASGESGGAPAGGSPQGPTHLISSNQAAIGYNKAQAVANRKVDMKKYLDEPMHSNATDSTLRAAFVHSDAKDNNKFAAAQQQQVVKTAAARALLAKLAEQQNTVSGEK